MHTDSGIPTKPDLRKRMRTALHALSAGQLDHWSRRIVAHLAEESRWRGSSGPVALFGGLRAEPDLLPLIPWMRERRIDTVFFGVDGRELVPFRASSPAELRRNPLGFWEPDPSQATAVVPAQLSAILVPGLAFSKTDGSRLGRGAGFYDRFFARPDVTARRIGVAFGLQLVDRLPTDPHDEPMHALVTETGWTSFA